MTEYAWVDHNGVIRLKGTPDPAISGGGTVNSVTAADTSIVVGGTAADPTIATATLDVIATDHAPAANWSNNSKKITNLAVATASTDAASLANTLNQFGAPAADVAWNSKKITGLANGSAASDAAAFGQIPTALPPNGSAGGDLAGTYPNPTIASGFSVRYTSGLFYGPVDTSTASTGTNQLTAVPYFVPTSTAFDRIAVNVTVAAATAVVRLGIYNDNGSGMPGSLLVDAGTVDASTTGLKTATISQTLRGLYWLAAVGQTAACTVASVNTPRPPNTVGFAAATLHNVNVGFLITGVSGTLPDPYTSPAGNQGTTVFCPFLRAA